MLNKHIVPAGIVACVGIFIWAFLSGREQLSVSPKAPSIDIQSVNVTPSVTELTPKPSKVTTPPVDSNANDNQAVKDIKAIGWPYKGTVLPTSCFSTEWISSDNYKEYAEQFGITDFDNFTTNMGQYLGREITNLKRIPAWGETISLVRSLSSCATELQQPELKDGYVSYDEDYSYRVVGNIPVESCNDLAPHLSNNCSEAFVVQLNSFGGSIGVIKQYYAYGLFDLPELGPSIVPLRNLGSLDRSLSFVDEQRDTQQECLVDGEVITITGTIGLETFAGPPNYSSIENGDEELKYWILTSNETYQCGYGRSFESGELIPMNGTFRRFQIVDQGGQLAQLAETKGSDVSITGDLMDGHTGYHNTAFLLIAKEYGRAEAEN